MGGLTIGIDVGTTGTKTILFDSTTGIVAHASRESRLVSEHPGFSEADPAQWLRNASESIREILATTGVNPRDIGAVSTTGMVPAVVAIDAGGAPLRTAILQNDARAVAELDALKTMLAPLDLVGLTGSGLTQQSVAPTALWLRRHEPDVWARTCHLVGSYDWMLIALGAEIHVERNWAIESGMYALGGDLLPEVLSAGQISSDLLPRVVDPGTQIGEMSAAAAEACGLLQGTALVVGGADHVLSAFAAGVERSGDWLVKLGGAGDILVASETALVDARLYLDAHPIPGRWLPNGCMATSGSLIRWYQSLVGGERLTTLDAEAELRPPAGVLCLPYFLGEKSPLHDPDLRGSFAGLSLSSTRADLYRSVLEAIAFGFRSHADIFRELGLEQRRVMVTNGGSKSTLWKQIHAEILGTEMFPVVDHPGASLGAAIIAAIGIGALERWAEVHRFVTLGDPVVPRPDRVRIYDEAYSEWQRLGSAIAPISHSLATRTRE